MNRTPLIDNYFLQLDALLYIVEESNKRVLSENPDSLFLRNTNFFTKSYLVMMCTYVESYIKDILVFYADFLDSKLRTCCIPYNILKWSFQTDSLLKEKERKESNAEIKITKENIDKNISANPYRTIELFINFGIKLSDYSGFVEKQEKIASIVTKRNQIIHYNDDASDVSDGDLKDNIIYIKEYMAAIDKAVCDKF